MLNVRATSILACLLMGAMQKSVALAAPDATAQPAASAPTLQATEEPTAPPPPSAPEPTLELQKQKTEASPPRRIKWRPLVLRSEIPPDQRPIFGSFAGTYLMAGANVGLALSHGALLLGAETSVVRQTTEFAWYGGYMDGVRDFGRDQTRFSIGPEVGWSAFGLDLGYLMLVTRGDVSHGITIRPLVSLGYVTVFGRFSKDLTAGSRVWSELGLLLKYPFAL